MTQNERPCLHHQDFLLHGRIREVGLSPLSTEVIDNLGNRVPVPVDTGTITLTHGSEGDVAPRPFGNKDGTVTVRDWAQVGLFASGRETVGSPSEFQRADCAPRQIGGSPVLGDGVINLADWVQAGRYALGLDAPVPKAGGPSAPTQTLLNLGTGLPSVAQKFSGARQTHRSLRVHNREVGRNQSFLLWVELDAQGDENAVGFSVRFPTNALDFVGARAANGLEGVLLLTNERNIESGRLGLALALPPGQAFPPGLRTLVELEFKSLSSAAGSNSGIQFVDDPVQREVVAASAHALPSSYFDGTIAIGSATGKPAEPREEPKLSVVGRLPEGYVLLRLGGEAEKQYLIETSEDLGTWHPIKSIRMTSGGIEFVDVEALGLPGRFYRVKPTN